MAAITSTPNPTPRPIAPSQQSAPRPMAPPSAPQQSAPRPVAPAPSQPQSPQERRVQRVIETVYVPTNYARYGVAREQSPNRLYRAYLKWFLEKYGTSKRPLSFKKWVAWAKTRGIVPHFYAGGEQDTASADVERKVGNALRLGWYIGLTVLTVGGLWYVISEGMENKAGMK